MAKFGQLTDRASLAMDPTNRKSLLAEHDNFVSHENKYKQQRKAIEDRRKNL
jgi:hypothetical protein